MNEWIFVIWAASLGAAFLFGRWCGILEYDDAMVKSGKLPPKERR